MDSAWVRVLRSNRSSLCHLFAINEEVKVYFLSKLYEKSLVSMETKNSLKGKPGMLGADTLLDHLEVIVDETPHLLDLVIQLMNEIDDMKVLVKKIEEDLKKLKMCGKLDSEIKPSSDDSPAFLPQMCGCGKCTIIGWRTGRVCQNICVSEYPKLLIINPKHSSALSLKQTYDHHAMLCTATSSIIKHFQLLASEIWDLLYDSVDNKKVEVSKITRVLRTGLGMQLPMFNDLDDVQNLFHSLCVSWYNFNALQLLMERVVAKLSPVLLTDWNGYLERFKEYCLSRSLKNFNNVFFRVEEHSIFLLEVDDHYNEFTLLDIENLSQSLSIALGCSSVCLHLITVKIGSLLIYFHYCYNDYLTVFQSLTIKQLKMISQIEDFWILSLTDLHNQFRYDNIQSYAEASSTDLETNSTADANSILTTLGMTHREAILHKEKEKLKRCLYVRDARFLIKEAKLFNQVMRLEEEIRELKKQIHSRDIEFSEREIKLNVRIKKHEEFIASLTEEIDHLTKEAHCRDIELLATDNEMTSKTTMLEAFHELYRLKQSLELNNTLTKELKDLKSQMQLKDAEFLKEKAALIEQIKLKEEFIASLTEEIDHLTKEADCKDIELLAKDNEMTSTITMLEDSSKDLIKEKEQLKRQLHLRNTELFRTEAELHESIKRKEELSNALMKELKDLKSQMQLKDAEFLEKETTLIENIKLKEEQISSISKELTNLKEKIHLKHMDLLKAKSEYADNIRKKQEMNTSLTKKVENLRKDMHFKVIVSSKKEAELCEKIRTLEGFNFSLSKDVEELKMLLHTKDIELKKSNEEVVCIKEQEACLLKEIQEVRKQAYLKELEHSQREVELVKKYQGMSHLKETEYTRDETERIKNLKDMTSKPMKTIVGLNYPWGIAVRRNGDILVVENRAHCVTIVNKDGVKVSSFGSNGTKNGQFNHPRGIAISDDGCVLVTDSHRLQKLTLDGVCIKSVESGSGHQGFHYPNGITTHTTTGQIFVADTYNNRIQIFNNDLIFLHTITLHGDKKFDRPYDIAVDSHGYLYVAEYSNDCITKLTTTGEYITRFGSYGLNPGQLFRPCSLTIYNDYVYVCEHGNNRVSVFTIQGNFLRCYGKRGREVGALNNPYAITSDCTGTLYISDTTMNRIIIV